MSPRQITAFGWSAVDDMQQAWHCLGCARRFRWGQARVENGALRCPECGNAALARAGTPGIAVV